jgi:hydroxyacylglutathione hydrolase
LKPSSLLAVIPVLSARPALAALCRAARLAGLAPALLLPALPAAARAQCCDPWTDLGQSLPGTHGAPLLEASGSLADLTLVTLDLSAALQSSPAWLVAGLAQLDAPFKGGVLVPAPQVLVPLATDASGMLGLSAPWPAGLPAGTPVLVQCWVQDPAAVAGFAASNAQLGLTPQPPPAGSFPADWIYGECATDPNMQVHQYGENTFLLRQSQCSNFEGPFVFLLFGQEKALLLDTGANGAQTWSYVQQVIAAWLAAHQRTSIPLVVAHTHGHGDHVAGDSQFANKPGTTLVGTSVSSVIAFWGFQSWPTDTVQYDLGGRVLDVLAIPGHQAAHIAVYDHETALLLTGDTLYPGFLFISGAVSQGNFATYKASVQRLVDFTADKPVAWIWGCHVEMKSTPFEAYPYGTKYQPLERDPQLMRSHLLELNAAVQAMGSSPHVEAHADFIIQPSG